MNALFERGWILDPVGKAKSVVMTEDGGGMAVELFEKIFGVASVAGSSMDRA